MSDRAYNIAADELRQFIEQYEQEEAEKKEVSDRQKAIMAEAKARGYNTKMMKRIIAEEDAILDMYKAAMGMV